MLKEEGRPEPGMTILSRFRQIFARGAFHRSLGILVGGTAISGGLVILLSPIVTRLYDPAHFGTLAVFNAFLGPAAVIASLRYEWAILLPKEGEDALSVLGVSLAVLAGTTATSAIVVCFLTDQISRLANNPGLHQVLWLFPFGLFVAGFLRIADIWRLRERSFSRITASKVGNSGALAAAQIGLGMLHAGTWGLIAAEAAGRLIGCVVLTWDLAWKWVRGLFRLTPSLLWSTARRYRRFPLISSGSALMDCVTSELPALIIAGLHGPKVAGLYYLAHRVLMVPSVLVAQSTAQVYVSEASRTIASEPLKLRRLFFSTSRLLFLIGILPFLVMGIAAPWLCRTVFGARWFDAGEYIQILLAGAFAHFLSSPVGGTIDLLERQDLHFIREIISLMIMSASLFACSYLKLSPVWTLVLISLAVLCRSCVYWSSSWWAIRGFERRLNVAKETG